MKASIDRYRIEEKTEIARESKREKREKMHNKRNREIIKSFVAFSFYTIR